MVKAYRAELSISTKRGGPRLGQERPVGELENSTEASLWNKFHLDGKRSLECECQLCEARRLSAMDPRTLRA